MKIGYRIKKPFVRFFIVLLGIVVPICPAGFAQSDGEPAVHGSGSYDFTDAVNPSTSKDEGLPWIENIHASHYSDDDGCWGGYGNRMNPKEDLFVALPASTDTLDCLGGLMCCRISKCDEAQPLLDSLLSGAEKDCIRDDTIAFWPESGEAFGPKYPWIIEGDKGDGLFRIIEIKMAGSGGPVIEAYVGDVGPWNQFDPYWATGTRPDAEDGIDMHGRHTNKAGIDISYGLAKKLGFTGMGLVDWRWKTIDGAYVVRRMETKWRN